MNGVTSAFLLTFAGLFPIVNPIEGAPFFLGLTANLTSAERQVLARKAAVNGFALLLGSMALVWNTLMERPTESISGLGVDEAALRIDGITRGCILAR